MKKNLISVVLPVWNQEMGHLKKCIDSILFQTYSELELIIVYKKSNESDTDFYNLIEQYSDKRIKIINDKNKGLPHARNDGITNSEGEFVAVMDGDDFCELNRFERQLDFKRKHNYNLVGSWVHWVSNDGKLIAESVTPSTHHDIRKKIMYRCPIYHPTVLMDRQMLDDIGMYNTRFVVGEDYELYLKAISKGYKVGIVPEFLVNMRLTPDSVSRGSTWKKLRLYTIRAKNLAILHYGFHRPLDIICYLPTPFTYFISPKLAMKGRKILNRYTGKNFFEYTHVFE